MNAFYTFIAALSAGILIVWTILDVFLGVY